MAKEKVEMCVTDINTWMVHNGLKMNQDKSELLFLTSKFRARPAMDNVHVIDENIAPSFEARNHGAIMDSNLSFKDHVKNICKYAHFHFRNIGKIRKYLDEASSEILINAFVSSKLDHCNSLLFGLPAY